MRNIAKRTSDKPIKVYGASDDLIELEGGIREEFNNDGFLVFDDGTVLKCEYDTEGIWRINVVENGTAQVKMAICTASRDDDDSDYSDVATITGDVSKVTFWEHYPPTRFDYVKVLEALDFADLGDETLKAIYELVADKL